MKYIVMPVIGPRGYITYDVVDTTTQAHIRRYDCELWANHEAKALNKNEKKDKNDDR